MEIPLRAPTVLVILTLLLTAASGCLQDDGAPAATQTTAASATGGNGTSPTPADNSDPVLEVTVSFNGTDLVAENGSFMAEVGANLTFDASNSTDADGDGLTFTWDFGDGNTSEEASPVYAYGAAGNYTVNVTADDGNNGTASQSLSLVVAPGGPAPGTVLKEDKQTFSGTYTASVQGTSCVNSVQGQGASKANEIIIPETEMGASVKVTKWAIVLTGGTTSVDQAFRFTTPDGKNTDVDAGSDNGEKLTVEGEFPPGKYVVTVYGCVAVNGSWNLSVTSTWVAA